MNELRLPLISYKKFKKTRDTIQFYAEIISELKGKIVPHQKNWEEFSLQTYIKGFTTGPVPITTNRGFEAFELNLDLVEHKLKLFYNEKIEEISLMQKNVNEFLQIFKERLGKNNLILPDIKKEIIDNINLVYDITEADNLLSTFRQIYFALMEFKGKTLFETSSINFWPHHFDMAVLVFSGKLIDGQDPQNWDYSREQMNFGFSMGDKEIPEPYFYITAHPFNENLFNLELPEFVGIRKTNWKGFVIKYSKMRKMKDFPAPIIKFMAAILKSNFR
jgi:hypothetical protein